MRAPIHLFVASLIAATASTSLHAQSYPTRPITYVIASTAGGGADVFFRPIAEALGKALGQPIVMDYRSGAGSDIASLFVKSAPPDGYTLYGASNQVVVRSFVADAKLDARRDFTHVARIGGQAWMIAVNTEQIKATSLRELVEDARRRPGQINYASYGIGTGAHLIMEMLLNETKVSMTHVPYKGTAQSVADTVAGRTQVTIAIMQTLSPHLASTGGSGRLRVLSMSSAERSPAYPDVPGAKESGYQLDYMGWSGVLGPPGMPADLVATINRAQNEILRDPVFAANQRKQGNLAVPGTPEDFKRFIERDYDAHARLIKDTGLKLE